MSVTIKPDADALNKRIEELSPERRALLARLLKAKGVGAPQATKIHRREKSDFTPLSFAQQRLWVLHQLDPTNPSYNMPDAVRLRGRLDIAALEQCFKEIVRRHDVLRTSFRMTEHGPEQVVADRPSVNRFLKFALVDLSEMEAEKREAEARRLAAEEAVRPFDLAKGETLRVKVARLNEQDHVILFTMHHIASDMWSLNIFAREIMALYDAFSQGKPSPLPELAVQYADFAVWQREWLRGETFEKQLAYWKEHLTGAPALLKLPTDRPRPPVQSFRGASRPFTLSKELSEAFSALTRQEDVTLFMSLLAAFDALLYRYTGQTDIVVGTPMAGRNQSETEAIIGFFVNTLALRTKLAGELTFRQLLKVTREVALGASAHQDFPFERLVEELQPERSLSYTPLFQVMFALQSVRGDNFELPGLKFVPMSAEGVVAKFDLTLFMSESGGEVDGSFEYNTDLFDAATIDRMIGHFKRLLEGIVASPDQKLSELPLLTETELRTQVEEWNRTSRPFPEQACLHHLFEQQALQSPSAAALRCGEQVLSYARLDALSDLLAARLRSQGVSPDVLVGVACRSRSTRRSSVWTRRKILKLGKRVSLPIRARTRARR
ncbi:MAG: condensation domain-containing protein [Acidobacteria bacterium]|nr:condensation domain-containing protein [Acidobacteriota bacterium]